MAFSNFGRVNLASFFFWLVIKRPQKLDEKTWEQLVSCWTFGFVEPKAERIKLPPLLGSPRPKKEWSLGMIHGSRIPQSYHGAKFGRLRLSTDLSSFYGRVCAKFFEVAWKLIFSLILWQLWRTKQPLRM